MKSKHLLIVFAFLLMPAFAFASDSKSPQALFLESIGCKKGLIINGDDLGRTVYSNEGILKAFNEGVLTSTSLMTAALSHDAAYKLIKEHPEIKDVGVHLELARDNEKADLHGPLMPRDKVPSLVDANGSFKTDMSEVLKTGDKNEIEMELHAQIQAAYDNGVDVTHLDCHKGFYHTYDQKTLRATIKLAVKYDLPIRWAGSPTDGILRKNGIVVTDYMTGVDMNLPHAEKKKKYIDIISNLKDGLTEIFIHPATGGYSDAESTARKSDLAIATDPDIKKLIEDKGICLVGYRQLRDFQRKLRESSKAAH